MFGYVKTDVPNIIVKDLFLYKSMYCGLCKGIGEVCGQKGRFTLNYDLTFLSVLVHNVMGEDVKIEKERCILHTIKKRPIAKVDELTKRIGALNVILAYHKLLDDKLDEKKGNVSSALIKSSYKKAKKKEPAFDKMVSLMYADLVKLERENIDSVDRIADPFGALMVNIVRELTGEFFSEALESLSYNLGKWIYLIDALDDFDKDRKKKNYNVFNNIYSDIKDKCELLAKNKLELENLFGSILCDITESAKMIDYKFNHELIDNVLNYGLKAQTKRILENKKCEKNTKF